MLRKAENGQPFPGCPFLFKTQVLIFEHGGARDNIAHILFFEIFARFQAKKALRKAERFFISYRILSQPGKFLRDCR